MKKLSLVAALTAAVCLSNTNTASATLGCWGWSYSWAYHHAAPHLYHYYMPGGYAGYIHPCYIWPCEGPNCKPAVHGIYHKYYFGPHAEVNRGVIIVSLPEDAKLIVEGHETKLTSGRRVFVTPKLEKGREYAYSLKAEIVRNGAVKTATEEIRIRPGQTQTVRLTFPPQDLASK